MFEKVKNRKKEITLLVIAILVIVSMIAVATYAFFKAQIGPASNFDINATTGTTDNLTFSTDGDIILNITADNLGREKGDYSKSSKARARLIKSNTSESTTANYNIYLLIEENELEYSSYTKEGQPELRFMTKEEKEKENLEGYTGVPELVLSVKKGGKEYKIEKRLKETTGGYDITEADGLYAIGENIQIISNGDVTDEWEITVTFKNLEYNQQLNTGRSLKGKIIITAEKLLYEINNADELKQLSSEVNGGDSKEGKYYVLTNNIDLGEHQDGVSNFTPIGTNDNRFKGNFNGDKYTISNLYINNITSEALLGLFGVTENSIINNLKINGDIISNAQAAVGSIVSNAYNTKFKNIVTYVNIEYNYNIWHSAGIAGAIFNNTLIENCHNYGNISGGNETGGLVGYVNNNVNLTIKHSSNSGNIDSKLGQTVGGLIGTSTFSTSQIIIEDSYNDAELTMDCSSLLSSVEPNIGGFIGYNSSSLNIVNSNNKGNISVENLETIYNITEGGIIGYSSNNVSISLNNVSNSGSIDALTGDAAIKIGGIVGETASITNIENCSNIGKLSVIDNVHANYIGGLVGRSTNSLTINNSYNNAILDRKNKITNEYSSPIGGLVASMESGNNTITNSYNLGDISGGSSVGGILGVISNDAKYLIIDRCYNKGNVISEDGNYNWGYSLGGIIGVSNSIVYVLNSYNTGELRANPTVTGTHCGGLIGFNSSGTIITSLLS